MASSSRPRLRRESRDGADLLILENGRIRVTAWPENGAAVLGFEDLGRGLDALWRNPLLPHRRTLLAQPIAGFSDLYDVLDGSWFISLPTGFFPTEYFGAPIGAHGEFRAVPFSVEVLEESAERVRVKVVGRSVRTPLVLERVWELAAGSPVLAWEETLLNRSDRDRPAVWMHHPTFGGELIRGAELRVAARTVSTYDPGEPSAAGQLQAGYRGAWPHVPQTAGGRRDCSRVPAAGTGWDHSVELTDFAVGWGCVWNEGLRLGFGLRWDEKLFPWAWSWVNSGGIPDYPMWGHGHLVTLQPGTSPAGRFPDLVQAGAALTVPAGGRVATRLLSGFTDRPDEPWALA
jgi:hypothetical protein